MPPSTSSSTTRSACDSPCCGALASVLSSLRTRTGWSCSAEPPPSTGRPVSGQVSGSSFFVGADFGSSLLSLPPLVIAAAGGEPEAESGQEGGDADELARVTHDVLRSSVAVVCLNYQ